MKNWRISAPGDKLTEPSMRPSEWLLTFH